MQFPGVEEVEYLQPDEGVEDHGEMSGVVFGGVKGSLVIFVPIYMEKPSNPDALGQPYNGQSGLDRPGN